MDRLRRDLRFSLRSLAKSPGFTVAAVLTLALGIGANTAIFTVVASVVLKPLPFAEPQRLMVVNASNPEAGYPRFTVSPPDFLDLRAENSVFTEVATLRPASLSLIGDGDPERLSVAQVSAGYFEVFGIEPLLGRVFSAEEDQPGGPRVVVLAHDFWQRRFGGDRGIEGTVLDLDGEPHTVVGVGPPGLPFPWDLWRPLALRWDAFHRGQHILPVFARLRDSVDVEAARAEMATLAARLAASYPETNSGWTVLVDPFHERLLGDTPGQLATLWAAVGLVLLIGCVNLAHLLLARLASRERELALRAALGASRGRLIREALTESSVLALLGGAAGVVLAYAATPVLVDMAAGSLPRSGAVRLDGTVLAFAFLLSLATGLLFGLLPAWRSARPDLQTALKEGGARGALGAPGGRLRGALVVAEVALALVLLVCASLLVRSFDRLRRIDLGFEPAGLVTAHVSLPRARYVDDELHFTFYRRLAEELGALPGVEGAGVVFPLPLDGGRWVLDLFVEGRPVPPPEKVPSIDVRFVSPGFFATLGLDPPVSGRVFTAFDLATTEKVVVINESAARLFWPGGEPLGQRLSFDNPDAGEVEWRRVVGVVRDIRSRQLTGEAGPEVYQSVFQARARNATVVVRAAGELSGLVGGIEAAVHAVDPILPVYQARPFTEVVDRSLAQPRFNTLLFGLFAGLALVLALIGVYGVVAYTVHQSRREIGVRIALGAGRGAVFQQVLARGMGPVVLGVVVGVGAALLVVPRLGDELFGVASTDPWTFTVLPLLLTGTAFVACWLPARRAMRVDPALSLRED